MHEVGLAKQALDIAVDHAMQANAQKITRIKIDVGALSGVEPDALEFAFSVLLKGTIAEGAEVSFSIVPVTFRCLSCAQDFEPESGQNRCPTCKSQNIQRIGGLDLRVASIEVV
jgi:hydrogenase nickel incorporation protein HypA/HybF